MKNYILDPKYLYFLFELDRSTHPFRAAFYQMKRIRGGIHFKNLGQSSSSDTELQKHFFDSINIPYTLPL